MKPDVVACLPLVLLFVAACSVTAAAPAAEPTPIGDVWWPSEWGADDERGAVNRLTPEKVLEAARLIRKGESVSLGRIYESGMPIFGQRHYSLTMVGRPSSPVVGSNQAVWQEEVISGELAHLGTQLDGLGHVGVRMSGDDYLYNGLKLSEIGTPYGLTRLGIEKTGPFFTRGVLLDVARYKKTERLGIGYEITAADLEGAAREQGITVRPGDAVLIHTGHGSLWMVDNESYGNGAPGIGIEAAAWLAERKIALVGADTWGTEVAPSPRSGAVMDVHQYLIVRHGIYNVENLDLAPLVSRGVHEFAFILSPLKLKGATGSPVNPIAVF